MRKAIWAAVACAFLWQVPLSAQTLISYTSCPPPTSPYLTDPSWTYAPAPPNFTLGWQSCYSGQYVNGSGTAFQYLTGNVLTMVVRTGGSGPQVVSEYLGMDNPNTPQWYFRVDLSLSGGVSIIRSTPSGSATVASFYGVSMHDNMSFRTIFNNGMVGVDIDGVQKLAWIDNSVSPGFGHYGGFGVNSASQFGLVSLTCTNTSASPNAVPFSSIGITPFTNHIDMTWPAATDGTGGWGIWEYQILRNGVLVGSTTGLSFSDTTVAPGVSYSYQLKVINYMLNYATTAFTAQTPGISANPPYPSVNPEGRQVGVRPTGTYWGATGENIDVRSGNLNFSLPLITAQARNGWSVPFNLNYNSQNWRKDNAGTNWDFDTDVGYGFGWRLQAGSITAAWNPGGFTADHFLFMDSTGAEYRLDHNTGNVWLSTASNYVWFDANTSTLHFRDGSSWFFGCVSASTEADAGTMYPTLMQDTNGNQIAITYIQASGATWPNSSARISTVTDVRAPSGYPSYQFYYNGNSHLAQIYTYLGTGETYNFYYLTGQALSSPFDGTSFPSTTFLSSITTYVGNYTFTHNGSGELTKVVLPHAGYLAYDYTSTTYSSNFSYREVVRRYLSKDGSTQTTYPFSHEPSPGPDVHAYTILDDPGGVGEKYWAFSTSGFTEGLVTQYQGRQLPGPVTKIQNDFTWAQDTALYPNSYISRTLTTADPGQPYQIQKQTNQTVDIYGNVTQVQNFDWGNLTTPVKTFNYTYLAGTGSHTYITDYIRNRLLTASVTDAGSITTTLATNYYDGATSYFPVNYGPGNLTTSFTLAATSYIAYNSNGTVNHSTVNGVTKSLTYDTGNTYSVPTQITVGSLTNTIAYNSFLGATSNTGPNGDVSKISYANISRPSSTTNPYLLATNYAYGTNTTSAVVNGRWTRTTMDGLGRTIKIENGTGTIVGSNIVNQADTVYDSCGCSPLGKMKQVSLPHASGAGAIWTTYTYDGIGRTLSVLQPDGASTSTYSYQGNVVTVTDPAGAWKKSRRTLLAG